MRSVAGIGHLCLIAALVEMIVGRCFGDNYIGALILTIYCLAVTDPMMLVPLAPFRRPPSDGVRYR